jgi:hypothetical protein
MEIQSHNSESASLVRQLFVPNPVKILLYLLTGFITLAVSNIVNFWTYFYATPDGQKQVIDIFGGGPGLQDQGGFFSTTLQGRLGQIVVWGLIGIGIYIAIWFIKNIITNLRNDVVADEYVHPHSYSRTSYWRSIAVRKGMFILIGGVLLGYMFLCYQLLPILSNIFFTAITNIDTGSGLNTLTTTVAVALMLHVLVVLIQLAIHSWRFISSDL